MNDAEDGARAVATALDHAVEALDPLYTRLNVHPEGGIVNAVHSVKRASVLKQEGNEHFRRGALEHAIAHYDRALASNEVKLASVLLSNQSACYLSQGRYMSTCLAALSALAVTTQNFKAFYRLSQGLLELHHVLSCTLVCDLALQSFSDNETFCDSIRALVNRSKGIKIDHPITSDSLKKTDEKSTIHPFDAVNEHYIDENEYNVGFAQIAEINTVDNVLSLDPAKRAKMKTEYGIDCRFRLDVPNLAMEFMKEGMLPPHCDASACRDKLVSAYHRGIGCPTDTIFFLDRYTGLEESDLVDLQKRRWGIRFTYPRFQEDWLDKANYGDILWLKERVPYLTSELQPFRNSPPNIIRLQPDSRHVSLGFVDIAELLYADYQHVGLGGGRDRDNRPVTWVGIEQSVYCCCVVRAVAEMLSMEDVPALHLLQVMYSSVWRRETNATFREAVRRILSKHNDAGADSKHKLNPEMLAVFLLWNSHEVPILEAGSEWLRTRSRSAIYICNLLRKADRLAVCEYHLTGALLGGELGSVVMFGLPRESYGNLETDIHFLGTIHVELLNEAWMKPGAGTVVDAACDLVLERIELLRRRVRAGKVFIQVHNMSISPENSEVFRFISALDPSSISWSNLCDYFTPQEMGAMLRQFTIGIVSPGGKVNVRHYMSSRNWKKGARSVIIQLPMIRNWTVSWNRLDRYLAHKTLEEYLPLLPRNCPNASAVTIPVLLVSPSDGKWIRDRVG
eukprot:gene1774-2082_t